MKKPNLLVILIDDLRFDEFGAGGHPYMKTPHIDRLAAEGALFERAFHTTPICSPNRASIVTGQYAEGGSGASWTSCAKGVNGKIFDAVMAKLIELQTTP